MDRDGRRLRRRARRLQRQAAARRTGSGSPRSSRTRRSGCPRWATSGSRSMINGPEAFTPDNEFCLGETEVRGFFVAAGFCAHGIAGAGGIGQVMAAWILDGDPGLDLWHMDVRRFGRRVPLARLHAGPGRRELRELLRHPPPGQPSGPRAGRCAPRRPTRGTPRTARCSARRPAGSGSNYYSSGAGAASDDLRPARLGRARLVAVRAARAPGGARAPPALFDETSFAKIEITGPDAAAFCRARLRRPGRPGAGRGGHLHPGAERPRRRRAWT